MQIVGGWGHRHIHCIQSQEYQPGLGMFPQRGMQRVNENSCLSVALPRLGPLSNFKLVHKNSHQMPVIDVLIYVSFASTISGHPSLSPSTAVSRRPVRPRSRPFTRKANSTYGEGMLLSRFRMGTSLSPPNSQFFHSSIRMYRSGFRHYAAKVRKNQSH